MMKRIIELAAAVSLTFTGVAQADHWHGGHGGGGPVIRDHRGPAGPVVRDHRGEGPGPVVRERRIEHVRVSGGRYVFPGGVVRTYHRPVIRTHYYDVRVRPAVVVENYDPVPGYVWVGGNWTWGGAEWVWSPGYWAAAEEPVMSGGVSVSAGVTFR
jgi:hypothetical protein